MDRISGILSITSEVNLHSDEGRTYQIIVLPIDTPVGWDVIVSRSVTAFRESQGLHVTLEGALHGNILASSRHVSEISLRSGTFRGRVVSEAGISLDVELRFESDSRIVSADFFRDGNFYCSMRAHVSTAEGRFVATSPRFIFDMQTESNVGGRLEFMATSPQVAKTSCVIPNAFPDTYRGELVSVSDFYRTLNIEVDKLEGLPWPPEYSTRDIPLGEQPSNLGNQKISLATLFQRAGIDARIHYNDGALDSFLGSRTGRPGEEDRWDERELHEMMNTNYSRNLNDREWWLYLLIVTRFDGGPAYTYNSQNNSFKFDSDGKGNTLNAGAGITGIIFDHTSGDIHDPWLPFRHLFNFGHAGSFHNTLARQGVAVFWSELFDHINANTEWNLNRQFLQTIVHELGHALNLAHSWLVGRPDTTSFMNYPWRYPHGSSQDSKSHNYWRDFDYNFDPEELFHFRHGFYHEVIPGGRLEFMEWTSSSIFHDLTAGGTRANISLEISPTKKAFQFTEPVTIEITIKNHSAQPQTIGQLSPSYGDTKFIIRRPNGVIENYQPPLLKCDSERKTLKNKTIHKHVTSLTVGHKGFVFETPGLYEITAMIPDSSTGILVIAKPISVWVKYPTDKDESVAEQIFNREAALFLYMAGGNHLVNGRDALEDSTERYPDHPFSAHANLVLGLNELSGQKSIIQQQVKKSQPDKAKPFLEKALDSNVLAPLTQKRLKSTIEFLFPDSKSEKKQQEREKKTK